MNNLYLCGFMGCGKTTIGQAFAKKQGRKYLDLDQLLVQRQGRTIPEIFAQDGEEGFRAIEQETLRSTQEYKGAVISTGGGILTKRENGAICNKLGVLVFLDLPFDLCYQRIQGDTNRPLVMQNTKEQLEELFNRRRTVYLAESGLVLDAAGTVQEIVARLEEAVKLQK